MSIPLDQLYHYIDQLAEHAHGGHVIIYRFYPYGSKEIKNLGFLKDHAYLKDILLCPEIFCNDQEPLDFDRYEQETFLNQETVSLLRGLGYTKQNFRDYPKNIQNQAILLHSEQRSQNLQKYLDDNFIPVYYWSHAVIARDWFRAAEYLSAKKTLPTKTFLIYNRAWSGTREYRLKFADKLIDENLLESCCTSVSFQDPELNQPYSTHKFKNPAWKPKHQLEQHFPNNTVSSSYSAVFDLNDYASTDLEIVLETLFDDDRLHLTEKSLRPIACGQPFVLAATHGSLEYLRKYGFQTYAEVWSEHYDRVQDPQDRMQHILATMKEISQWDEHTKKIKMQQAQEIADFNRQHFFSNNFFRLIISELETNLDRAFDQLKFNKVTDSSSSFNKYKQEINKFLLTHPKTKQFAPGDWNKIMDQVITASLKSNS